MADPSDWMENEHGLWCPACGNHIATPQEVEEDGFEAPESCRDCGFPDFEDGMGFFTGEDDG